MRAQLTVKSVMAILTLTLLVTVPGCSADGDGDDDDGRPSAAQYRNAVEAARECVRDAGFSVSEIVEGPDGRSLQFSVNADDADMDAASEAYDECVATHLEEIQLAYLGGRHLTGAEREEAMEQLVQCLEDLGVTGLSTGETDSRVFVREMVEQLGSESDEFAQGLVCIDRYRDVWPPGDANNP